MLTVVSAEGFGAVSMESIARAGGIAKTVVYSAFGDVDGALTALFAREQERAQAAIAGALPTPPFDEDAATLALRALRRLLDDVRSRPDSWRLIVAPGPGAPPTVRAVVEEHRQRMVDQIRPAVAWVLGQYDAGHLDDELVAYTAVAGVEHAARLTLERPDDFGADRIIALAEGVAGVVTARLAGLGPRR